MFKNLELGNLAKGLIISSGFDIMRILLLLSIKNISGVRAIVKADKDFVKSLRETMIKRGKIQQNRKLTDKDLYEMGSICSLKDGFAEFLRRELENKLK
jgi:hypothetical protein